MLTGRTDNQPHESSVPNRIKTHVHRGKFQNIQTVLEWVINGNKQDVTKRFHSLEDVSSLLSSKQVTFAALTLTVKDL